jgi:integrase
VFERIDKQSHTCATRLIANGIDYKTVQSLLSHASASATLNLYAHAEEGQRRAASDLIGSLMNGTHDSNKVVNL